jgi:CHAT domain-containing protein/tetratricopeptide (TPR) repeat protein
MRGRRAQEEELLRERAPGVVAAVCCLVVAFALAGAVAGRAACGPHQEPPKPPAPAPGWALPRGASALRDLAAGGDDVYDVDVPAGQVLYATFQQLGIDLYVDVYAPDGRLLYTADNLDGAQGLEEVVLVAPRAGRYRLEVRACLGVPGGRYVARLAHLRPASAADRLRAAAESLISQAVDWPLAPRTPARDAGAALLRACALFRQVGARRREAEGWYRLGRKQFGAHAYADAIASFNQANPLYRAVGDRAFVASSYSWIGSCHYALEQRELARRFYALSLAEWATQPPGEGRARTLVSLGKVHVDAGEWTAALRCYAEAIALLSQVPSHDRAEEARASTQVSAIYRALGDWDDALAASRRASALCAAAPSCQQAAVWNETARIYIDLGQPGVAVPFCLRALATGDPEEQAGAHTDLGVCYRRLGFSDRALGQYLTAIQIYQRLRKRRLEAIAWLDLAGLFRRTGQPRKAAHCYAKAQQLAHDTSSPRTEGLAMLGAGLAARDLGNLKEALAHGKEALPIVEALRGGVQRSDLRDTFQARSGDAYDFLIGVLMQLHLTEPGRLYDVQALQYCEQSRSRTLLDLLSVRQAPAAATAPDAATQAAFQNVAAAIADSDRELQTRALSPARRRFLKERLDDLLGEAAVLALRLRGGTASLPSAPASPRSITDLQHGLIDAGTLLLEYHVGAMKSFLWVVSDRAVSSFELPGRDQLEPLARAAYGQLAGTRPATDMERGEDPVARLSQILLGQVAGRLGSQRLVVVADGVLQYIPFAALPDPDPRRGGQLLVAEHEIDYAPSLAVVAALQRAPSAPAPTAAPAGAAGSTSKSIAVVADPVFAPDDPRLRRKVPRQTLAALDPRLTILQRLPRTRDEAGVIASLAGPRQVFAALDFDANAKLVTGGGLAGCRILHVATHGILRTDKPGLSALALSQLDMHGQPLDGFLYAYQVAACDLPADLVVLSGCKTALGKELGGEMVGLPRGFLSAGARRVLVSLWDLGDSSAAELMGDFYRGLLHDHLAPGAALHRAQLAMLRREPWRPPFRWASFLLEGDWR